MTKYDNIYEIYNTEQFAYEAFATAGVNSCKCVIRTAPCSIIVYEMHYRVVELLTFATSMVS